MESTPRQTSGSESRCQSCSRIRHFARECLIKEKTCNLCKTKGHLANMCRKKEGSPASGGSGSGSGGLAKPLVPAIKSKMLIFAKGTKRENAKDGAEGMVMEEVLSDASVHDASENVGCVESTLRKCRLLHLNGYASVTAGSCTRIDH